MLLYVLMQINMKLQSNELLDDYWIEIEKKEDFVIYKNNIPVSFHQVKALLSKKNRSDYNTALNKLLKHRDDSGAISATCHLVSAMEIKNWFDKGNIYKDQVELLQYNGEYIGIVEVVDFIKQEIEKYISINALKKTEKDVVYLELCNFLDEKVSKFHVKGKKRDYKIKFTEITSEIISAINKSETTHKAKLRESVYNHITTKIKGALKEYCREECCIDFEDCAKDCGSKGFYENLIQSNIWNYGHIINPSKTNQWTELDYVEYMACEGFKDNLYEFFSWFASEDVQHESDVSYIRDEYYDSQGKKIIPTLLKIVPRIRTPQDEYIQNILSEINSNHFVYPYLEGNVITAETNGRTFNTNEDKFTTNIDLMNNDESEKVTNINHGIMIVDRNKLLEKFEEE